MAMYEWMERMEKQMETLTTILHELRSKQRGTHIGGMRGSGITPGHADRRSNNEETTPVRGRITGRSGDKASEQPLRGEL